MFFQTKVKRMIILGVNEISINLANKLSRKYEIIILDVDNYNNRDNIDAIIEKVENNLLTTLNQYNIEDTTAFIAMTKNEEYNLFAARLANEYGASNTIAMVFNPVYINLTSADYIFNPYQLIINKTNSLVKETRLKNIKDLIPGKVNVTNFTISSNDSFAYTKINNFSLKDSLIIAIKRNNQTIIPYDNMKLLPGDNIYILYKKGMISSLFKQIWKKGKINRKVFIIGGNELGFIQARNWYNIFNSVVIIESNLQKCHQLAKKIDNILILNGEGVERELLIDEGLNKDSIVLAYDDNDFHNLLSSYSAKKFGCKNIITLLNHHRYNEITNILGLDNIISMPEIVSRHLILHLRSKDIFDKYFIDDNVYTSKILLDKGSSIIDKKISNLSIKNIIIGVVIRNNKIIIPDNDFVLHKGDNIIVFYDKNIENKLSNFIMK